MEETCELMLVRNTLRVKWDKAAQIEQVIESAFRQIKEMRSVGLIKKGRLLFLHCTASIPVAVTLAHTLAENYKIVAVFDTTIGKYVVAISGRKKSSPIGFVLN